MDLYVCVCVCVCVCSVQSSFAFPLVIFFQRIKVYFHEIPIAIKSVLANRHPWACWGVARGWGEHMFRSQWNWPQSPTPIHNFAMRTWERHLISWVAVLIRKCSQCLHETAHRKHLAYHSPWTYFQVYSVQFSSVQSLSRCITGRGGNALVSKLHLRLYLT